MGNVKLIKKERHAIDYRQYGERRWIVIKSDRCVALQRALALYSLYAHAVLTHYSNFKPISLRLQPPHHNCRKFEMTSTPTE